MTKAHHITIRTCKITIKAHDRHVMIYKFTEQIQFTQLNRSMDKHMHGYKKKSRWLSSKNTPVQSQ